ncbi:MAG: hypothetical protein EO766_16995 [Hydrotalea sp. AMD]|uniref:glucosaminidase domain-containing protein n=1 Tax=Hydrotalea sp. AMD TaxID=2501297 RepID=UPI001027F385|nr:glucosaminidase domain-containing protein [Hydrotalea sp. AMD]RWZ84883.1 MAG: hypothetical protein EO766_16995 [Hydrotalea sp. AMD]
MSTSNQAAFIQTYGPYAQYAGSQLGVSPDYVLGQWALETGYGTHFAGQNNLGNIQGNANQPYSYSSVQAGVDAYVNTLKNPRYAGALSASSPLGFGYALQNAGYATDSNYGYKVGSTIMSVKSGGQTPYNKVLSGISGGLFGGGDTGLKPDPTKVNDATFLGNPLNWVKSKGLDVGFIAIGVFGFGLLTYGYLTKGD